MVAFGRLGVWVLAQVTRLLFHNCLRVVADAEGLLKPDADPAVCHLLQDSDGDRFKDKVDTFWPDTIANYPGRIVVKDGNPHFVLADEIV